MPSATDELDSFAVVRVRGWNGTDPASASPAEGLEKVMEPMLPWSSSTEALQWSEERAASTRAGISAIAKKKKKSGGL